MTNRILSIVAVFMLIAAPSLADDENTGGDICKSGDATARDLANKAEKACTEKPSDCKPGPDPCEKHPCISPGPSRFPLEKVEHDKSGGREAPEPEPHPEQRSFPVEGEEPWIVEPTTTSLPVGSEVVTEPSPMASAGGAISATSSVSSRAPQASSGVVWATRVTLSNGQVEDY